MKSLAIASIFGYLGVFFITPLLARHYTPNDFGLYSVFSTCIILLSSLYTLGNEQGILNEKKLVQARRYYYKGLCAAIICFAMSMLLIVFLKFTFGNIFNYNWGFILSIPITTFVVALGVLAINWRIRIGDSTLASISIFTNLISRGLWQLIFSYFIGGIGSLIIGDFICRSSVFFISKSKRFLNDLNNLLRLKRKVIFSIVNKYTLYVTPKILLDNTLVWAPSLLFVFFYSPVVAGLIAVAQRFGSTPATIFNQTIGFTFQRSLVISKQKYPDHIFKWIVYSSLVGFVLFFCTSIVMENYGQNIVIFLLGSEWIEVSQVFIAMLPLYFMQIIVILVDKMMLYMGYIKAKLLFNFIHLIVMILSTMFCFYAGVDAYVALGVMSSSVTVSYFFAIFISLSFVYYMKNHKMNKVG